MSIKRVLSFLKTISREQKAAPFLIQSNHVISVGKESYHNGNFIVKGNGVLDIGNYCAIGTDVKVVLSNHNYNYISMQYSFYRKNFKEYPYLIENKKTIIEHDVWIGDNVILLPEVKIGTGAIIGANAVVTKNVEPYSIVGGNPAKLIKKRFSEKKIQELLQSEWWEWTDEKIKNNKDFFFRNHNEEE